MDTKAIPTGKLNKIVFAVILNYNTFQDVIQCVEKLMLSEYKNVKIIIVDNQSPNNSLKKIEADFLDKKFDFSVFTEGDFNLHFDKDLTLIQAHSNEGFAHGNNIALKKLVGLDAYVFLLNPDMIVTSNTIGNLVHCVESTHDKCIAGCTVMNYNTKVLEYFGVRLNHYTGTISLIKEKGVDNFDYLCGGAMLFHTSALDEIGLLPEDYFLYWEDADWGYMARKKGYRLVGCENALVYDKGATSIGRGYVAEYYYTRNSLIFHKKINKQVLTILFSNLLFKLPKKIFLRQPDRAKAVVDSTIDFLRKEYETSPKKQMKLT